MQHGTQEKNCGITTVHLQKFVLVSF